MQLVDVMAIEFNQEFKPGSYNLHNINFSFQSIFTIPGALKIELVQALYFYLQILIFIPDKLTGRLRDNAEPYL